MTMVGRITVFQGDPQRIDDGLRFVTQQVQPALAKLAGCHGIGVWVDRGEGVSIVVSAWADEASLKAGEPTVAGLRAEGARILAAHTMSTEILEPTFLHQNEPDQPGYFTRAVQVEIPRERMDEAIAGFREKAVPTILAVPGVTSVVQMVNRAGGRGVVTTTFSSREAFEASRGPAEETRARNLSAVGGRVSRVYETQVAVVGISGPAEVPAPRTIELPTETTV
jgi:quinol monooxygenase YgiN